MVSKTPAEPRKGGREILGVVKFVPDVRPPSPKNNVEKLEFYRITRTVDAFPIFRVGVVGGEINRLWSKKRCSTKQRVD